jgi:hypothetical protein
MRVSPVNNASRRISAVTFDNSVMATGRGGTCCRVKADIRHNSNIRVVEILFVGRWLGIKPCHGVHRFLASVTMWMAPWTTSRCSSTASTIVATTSRHFSPLLKWWAVYISLMKIASRLPISGTECYNTSRFLTRETASDTRNWTFSDSNTLQKCVQKALRGHQSFYSTRTRLDFHPWSLFKQRNTTAWTLKAIFTELSRGQQILHQLVTRFTLPAQNIICAFSPCTRWYYYYYYLLFAWPCLLYGHYFSNCFVLVFCICVVLACYMLILFASTPLKGIKTT